MKNPTLVEAGVKTTLLVSVATVIIWIMVQHGPSITHLAANPDLLKVSLSSFGSMGVFVFMGLQVLQVVVAALPGELVQIAGGFLYGTFWGTLYSLIGITIGSAAAFWISRYLGHSLLQMLVPRKQLNRFHTLISNPRTGIILFVLFLLPGMPKDVLIYAAGLTSIHPVLFIILSNTARIPSLLISSYIGACMGQGNYTLSAIVTAVSLMLLVLGLIMRNRVAGFVQKAASMLRTGYSRRRDQG